MSDLPTDEELRETLRIIAAAPKGPWNIEPSEHGLPNQIGPVCYLETWVDSERVPALEFIRHAREWLPKYMGAYDQQRAQIRALEARVRQLESFVPPCGNVSRHQRACDLPTGHDGGHQCTDRHVGVVRWPATSEGGARHGW